MLPNGFELSGENWISFLMRNGYQDASSAEFGDLVMYGYPYDNEGFCELHFGVIIDPARQLVVSKFGGFSAFIHPLGFVPDEYGDSVLLFRKSLTPDCLQSLWRISRPFVDVPKPRR